MVLVFSASANASPQVRREVERAVHKGVIVLPVRIEDVANGFTSIEEELRSQYLLEYRPADFKQDGAFRTIYLQANDPRYHVRAHTGYFAPKASD